MKAVMTGVCMLVTRNAQECRGIGDLFAAPILHIVRQSNLTSVEMASVILGKRCMSRQRFASSQLNWQITLPAELGGGGPDRANRDIHRFDQSDGKMLPVQTGTALSLSLTKNRERTAKREREKD